METNKKEMDLKKMQTATIIVSVVLGLVLIASIVISSMMRLTQLKDTVTVELGQTLNLKAEEIFEVDKDTAKEITFDITGVNLEKVGEYEAYAHHKEKEYTIKVVVEDTTAPKAEFIQRYVFTNNIETLNDFNVCLKDVKDKSKYTTKWVRFEKVSGLDVMNELALSNITANATKFESKEDALAVGVEDSPAEPGIYRSVLEIADESGNATYEEVILIFDTTAALITDVEDQVVEVAKDKLNEQPEINKTLYKAVDNVDGLKTGDDLTYELSLRDEAKYEWIVKVSYTDRAGNESCGEFLITVKEKKASSNSGTGTTTYPPNYNPDADTDKDGVVSEEEAMGYITPEKQTCIDAGYGMVCEFDGGKWYGVLMKDSYHTINGKSGIAILEEYLTERKLTARLITGCWIDPDNGWYWYTAEDISELITSEDEGFWS